MNKPTKLENLLYILVIALFFFYPCSTKAKRLDIFTYTEEGCLTANLFFEARGEGEAGMRAVADVVINRTKHTAFKGQDTACKVIFAPKQFSWVRQQPINRIQKLLNGDLTGFNQKDRATYQQAQIIAKNALDNVPISKLPKWVVNFHTVKVAPVWKHSMKYYKTIGQHVFYGFKKKG